MCTVMWSKRCWPDRRDDGTAPVADAGRQNQVRSVVGVDLGDHPDVDVAEVHRVRLEQPLAGLLGEFEHRLPILVEHLRLPELRSGELQALQAQPDLGKNPVLSLTTR